MSLMLDVRHDDALADGPGARAGGPRLVSGTELIGQLQGSGLREPPHLVRRCDGQVVQLSGLLFAIAGHLDGRDLGAVAESAGAELALRITPEQIGYVVERKLAPLGIVSADGSAPAGLAPRDVLLGLRWRATLAPATIVRRVAGTLRPLYWWPVVALAVLALATTDVWLVHHGLGRALHQIIRTPVLGLALFGVTIGSFVWHEIGHATACRYGGAQPGRIGAGVYFVWPAFYTDVTDSYRLSRAGRLRTDLGGVYFNGLFGLAAMGAYVLTGFAPLLTLVVGQQLILLDQFIPWMRLDGYHVISDLIGVSDLFERIRPVLTSLRPGSPPHPRVTELKPWARHAVSAWVVTTVVVLAAMLGLMAFEAPALVTAGWVSMAAHAHALAHTGDPAVGALNAVSIVFLAMPAAALALTYAGICTGMGSRLARRRERLSEVGGLGY